MQNQPHTPNFHKASQLVRQLYDRVLPVKIASEAEKWFKDSFRNQGFTDQGLQPWRDTKSGKKNRFGKPSMGILIGTGKLKRSIRTAQAAGGIVEITAGNQFVPYAQIHNEGGKAIGKVTVPGYRRKVSTVMRVSSSSLKTRKTTSRRRRVTTGTTTVKSYTKDMSKFPRRQYMGNSRMLNEKIGRIIGNEISALERQLFSI